MYITCIYLTYHCLGWYTVRIWVFVCVCCAAPDKLTSPPPFTGLGALQPSSKRSEQFGAGPSFRTIKELELHFFSISIPGFLCVSTPFLFLRSQKKEKWTPEQVVETTKLENGRWIF